VKCSLPILLLTALVAGCSGMSMSVEPPLLADMEEPLALFEEPEDEAERQALQAGSFSGIYVIDARDSLEALTADPEGLLVVRVIENSPAAAAGVEEGDLLFEALLPGGARALAYPADLRKVEIESEPGTRLELGLDRAGAELRVTVELAARVQHAERHTLTRYREEKRTGIVIRTATEVEARAVDLGPGGGAVIVGLSSKSPWRAAGLVYEDLVVSVDGAALSHPRVLLEAIRSAPPGADLAVEYIRGGERRTASVPTTRRVRELKEVSIPLIFSYENDGERKTTSMLLGLIRHTTTPAVWRTRLLWIISFGGGDADELVEVDV